VGDDDLAALDARKLEKSLNLSDLPSKPAARANLGLGDAATHAAGDFLPSSTTLPITNAAAMVALGATYALTGSSGAWSYTGLSITLPSAGTYIIFLNARCSLLMSAGGSAWLSAKLYNDTDGADVPNSEQMVGLTNQTGAWLQSTSSAAVVITVAASKTIKLYAKRDGSGPTFTISELPVDANGRTRMSYLKVA
jgi:hypothetical protein